MSGSILWIMCAVIVISLAVWLVLIALAQRRPSARGTGVEHRRGRVQGGSYTGGGRSVAPRRDAPAVFREDPEESAMSAPPERSGEGSGNPMDL